MNDENMNVVDEVSEQFFVTQTRNGQESRGWSVQPTSFMPEIEWPLSNDEQPSVLPPLDNIWNMYSVKTSQDKQATPKQPWWLEDLYRGMSGIKHDLTNNGRCPKCTLKMPCKHYSSPDEIEMLP